MKKVWIQIAFMAIFFNVMAVDNIFMTFNIRLDNSGDGVNQWENRKEGLVELLRYYQPGIFGIQEGLPNQVHFIDSCLYGYAWLGVGRDDGNEKGEFSALYYDTAKYDMLESATFWLSETPEKPSVGWDAALPRICTFGKFLDREANNEFWVFNTHFDHVGQKARENAVELIVKKIREINDEHLPAILMGDFNLEPDSDPIQFLTRHLEDTYFTAKKAHYGPEGTFHGFKDGEVNRRIDYIFVKDLKALEHRHIDDRLPNNNFVSDHLPVLVKVKF